MGGDNCAIVGCGTHKGRFKALSFHSLSKCGRHDEWRKKLIRAIDRIDSSFNPDKATICSRHFEETCFKQGPTGRKILIPGSLPTRWMPVNTSKPLPRKTPAFVEDAGMIEPTKAEIKNEVTSDSREGTTSEQDLEMPQYIVHSRKKQKCYSGKIHVIPAVKYQGVQMETKEAPRGIHCYSMQDAVNPPDLVSDSSHEDNSGTLLQPQSKVDTDEDCKRSRHCEDSARHCHSADFRAWNSLPMMRDADAPTVEMDIAGENYLIQEAETSGRVSETDFLGRVKYEPVTEFISIQQEPFTNCQNVKQEFTADSEVHQNIKQEPTDDGEMLQNIKQEPISDDETFQNFEKESVDKDELLQNIKQEPS